MVNKRETSIASRQDNFEQELSMIRDKLPEESGLSSEEPNKEDLDNHQDEFVLEASEEIKYSQTEETDNDDNELEEEFPAGGFEKIRKSNKSRNQEKSRKRKISKRGGERLADQEAKAMQIPDNVKKVVADLENNDRNDYERLFQERFRQALKAKFAGFDNWDELQNIQARVKAIEEAIESLPTDANVDVFRSKMDELSMPIYREIRRDLLDRLKSQQKPKEDKEPSSATVAKSGKKIRFKPLTGLEETPGIEPTKKGVRTTKRFQRSNKTINRSAVDIDALENQLVTKNVDDEKAKQSGLDSDLEDDELGTSMRMDEDGLKMYGKAVGQMSKGQKIPEKKKNGHLQHEKINSPLISDANPVLEGEAFKTTEGRGKNDISMKKNAEGRWVPDLGSEKPSLLETEDSSLRLIEDESLPELNLDEQSKDNHSEREKELQEKLESADADLTSARHAYYEARRKRMRWIGRGSKEKLKELRQAYEGSLSERVRAKVEFDIRGRGGMENMTEEELRWITAFDINARSEENQKVWQEEFDASEKSLTRKFEGWWQKHSKKRMLVSAGLLGAGFIPGLGALTVPLRAGLRGVGTGMLVEQSLGRYTKILGDNGLANKIFKDHKKELKEGKIDALKKEIENLSPEKVHDELDRLTVLAERQGVSLMEVGDGKLKPVIEALYEKSVVIMYENAVLSSESSSEDNVADGVFGFLDHYQKDIHLAEEGMGQIDREKEITRWTISAIAGTAMAAVPFMSYGQETSEGTVVAHEGISQVEDSSEVVSEVTPKVAPEVNSVDSADVSETPVPDVNSIPVAERAVEPDFYQGALEAASEVGAKGHNSVWAVLEAKAEAVAGAEEANLGEGKFTYLVDSIKDQIAEDPTKFGLPADIDRITAKQLADFAQNNNLNKLVAGSFFEQDGTIADALIEAKNLSDEAVANIESNNDFYQTVVSGSKGSGVTFDQAMYNIMDQAKKAGLDSAQTIDIVDNISDQSLEVVPEIVNFYAEHPDFVPSVSVNSLIAQYGAETAADIIKVTNGNMTPAVEKLIGSGAIDLSDIYKGSAAPWINLTESITTNNSTSVGVEKALDAVFKQAGIGDKFKQANNVIAFDGLAKDNGILSFTADAKDNGPINFIVNTNNMSINVVPNFQDKDFLVKVTKSVQSYATQDPAKALKNLLNSVIGK